jgi:hypothetical protein
MRYELTDFEWTAISQLDERFFNKISNVGVLRLIASIRIWLRAHEAHALVRRAHKDLLRA